MKKPLLIGITFACMYNQGVAQDIHFSQHNMAPLSVNPALTGAFNGDQRVILNYRDQWKSIGTPFRTFALSADVGLMKKKWKNSSLGAGLFVFNDKAGDLDMGITQASLSLSAFIKLDEQQNFSAGLQAGYVQRSIGSVGQMWDNQFDGTGYNPSLSSGETGTFSSFGFADVSAGLAWSYSSSASDIATNDEFRANAGIAFFHANQPKQGFLTTAIDKLHLKYAAHASLYISTGTSLSLVPSAIYYRQGSLQEINAGMLVRYTITEESHFTGFIKESAVSIGGRYRVGDAIIPQIMFEYANYAIGISYDLNISALKTATNTRGGIEISLRYVNPNPFRKHASGSNMKFL